MVDLLGSLGLSGVGSSVTSGLFLSALLFLIFAVILGLIGWGIWAFRERYIYTYPVTIIHLRGNGSHKENTGVKGGFKKNSSGVKDFSIKNGRWWWQKKFLGYTPDMTLADNDNRLTFIDASDGTRLQQVKKQIITEKAIDVDGEKEVYSLIAEPVPADVKTATINEIESFEGMMDKRKLTAYAITIIGFIIMAVVHVAFLYFVYKKGA